MSKKIRVAVLYGGRSGEHEISLQSAASVVKNLDTSKYEIIPIAIDKQGRWHWNEAPKLLAKVGKSLPIDPSAPEVILPAGPSSEESGTKVVLAHQNTQLPQPLQSFDVVFPVMHGPLCEDGTIQGLLELADVAYVGCGVLSSAVGMDKDVAKRLIRDAGLPIVPYIAVKHGDWLRSSSQIKSQVTREIGYPCFVKPANMGSSVGVHKVSSADGFDAAMNDALKYDTKILVEKAVSAREIELAVLENSQYGEEPLVSTAGEIAPTHDFYSYEAKYLDENGAALLIPAKILPHELELAQSIARRAFAALDCEGLARVDLFMDKNTGAFYFNEINTLPGFTQISMYPKMWEASGISYRDLLSRLIELAITRHERKQKLYREYCP